MLSKRKSDAILASQSNASESSDLNKRKSDRKYLETKQSQDKTQIDVENVQDRASMIVPAVSPAYILSITDVLNTFLYTAS